MLLLAVYLLPVAFSWLISPSPLSGGQLFLTLVIQLSVTGLFLLLLLYIKQVLFSRGIQTFAAMLGAGTVMSVLLLPMELLAALGAMQSELLADLILVVIYVWWLTIAGFILHRACNISHLQGSMFYLAAMLTSILLAAQLYPDELAAGTASTSPYADSGEP